MLTPPSTHFKESYVNRRERGFALIASLSIMAILVLIAVALFSLASVASKSASVAAARVEAQANAKMALMIAMGELQKTVGPDRAITATSEIMATGSAPVSKPNTAGVWESWNFLDPANPNASLNYTTEKINRFQRWLVSSVNTTDDPESMDFATTAWNGPTVELVGAGSLGAAATDEDKAVAGLVPISTSGESQGAYAWHVADESLKARVNLFRDPSQNTTLAEKRALNTGHLPDASVIKTPGGDRLDFLPTDATLSDFEEAQTTMAKVTDLEQAELLDQAQGKLKPLRNDITFYSLGVLSDARNGGLKKDLSSVFEMGTATANTLPAVFTGERLYQSTLGIARGSSTPYVSDPNWSALAGYYNSFRNLTTPDTDPTIELKPGVAALAAVPTEFNPAPVIARVDTIFSLVARPLDNMAGWLSALKSNSDYFLNLIYTPVVVLHNPYNVNVSFYRMDVTFENVPVAFNFMFQPGEAGSSFVSRSVVEGDFENLNTMLGNTETPDDPNIGRGNKRFGMSIADWSDALSLPNNDSIAGPIVLKPGQTLICGPVFPANSNYDQDTKSGGNTIAFDWQWDNTEDSTEITNVIKSSPVNVEEYGYIPGIGYEINSITIAAKRKARSANLPEIPATDANGDPIIYRNNQIIFRAGAYDNQAAIHLRDANDPNGSQSEVTDRFYVEYKVQQPEYYVDNSTNTQTQLSPEFTVTAQIQATASGSLVDFANLDFSYQDDATLQDIFEDRVYRYPPDEGEYLTGSEVAAPSGVAYSEQGAYVRPFAVFSALARTTNGGVYETGLRTDSGSGSADSDLLKDGRLAGKPFLFHNPAQSNYTLDLANKKPSVHAYELNFQPFSSNTDFFNYIDIDVNRVPALSGNQSFSGVKSGSYFEVPSGPLQTIADFRRSNALTTSYLPHFLQPVGNSSLHPFMSASAVIETNSNISSDPLLDHSVLANHALYDRFYFSTFATRGSDSPETVFEEFMNGTSSLMSQAFIPYLPIGQTLETAKAELYGGSGRPRDEAFATAAEYQMLRGPFNVNSTSVEAWKAVLAASNQNEITTLLTNADASGNSLVTSLATNAATGIPITGMSLPNGEAIPNAGYSDLPTGWNGYRELTTPVLVPTDSDLERLAVKIVEEVRERGPFLSMSEFVNRQIGPVGPNTISGALESAIAKAEINEVVNATKAESYLGQVPITTDDVSDTDLYSYQTPEASAGNPAAGAPGWVNQGDLLDILGPAATVRGDTFVIRVYGDAQSRSGKVEARAYGEAVVQRVPEYIDPGDRPSANVLTDPTAKLANKNFGRRFEVVSFRWLSQNEI